MKNLDSIPHTLDGIFRELNRTSNIIITITNTGTPGRPVLIHGEQGFSIDQVNGCHTHEEFYHSLVSLCASVRLSTVDAMQTLDSSEKGALLLQAIHRVHILLQKIISVLLTAEEAALWTEGNQFVRRFKHARFIWNEGIPEVSLSDLKQILLAAHPFAHHYSVALRILSIQLICLLTGVEHPPDLNPPGTTSPSEAREKLRFTGSVPCLAALGRILSSRNLFEIDNKSRFFRTITGMFSTSQQPDISWMSYKNHFNNPSHEALTFWDAEISELRKHIRKLMLLN